MNTKLVIAVIGASGNMGYAFSKAISQGNYRVLLQSPDSDKIQSIIDDIKSSNPSADLEAVAGSTDACWEADIIIIAVPYATEKDVARNIRNVVNQKIVISIFNPLNDTYTELMTSSGISAAEELQKMLPYAKVVKTFNTTFAGDFYEPIINGQQVDCFIAGNDEDALQVVYDLVKTAGFNPIIAGDLSVSRTLEACSFCLSS